MSKSKVLYLWELKTVCGWARSFKGGNPVREPSSLETWRMPVSKTGSCWTETGAGVFTLAISFWGGLKECVSLVGELRVFCISWKLHGYLVVFRAQMGSKLHLQYLTVESAIFKGLMLPSKVRTNRSNYLEMKKHSGDSRLSWDWGNHVEILFIYLFI